MASGNGELILDDEELTQDEKYELARAARIIAEKIGRNSLTPEQAQALRRLARAFSSELEEQLPHITDSSTSKSGQ